MLAILHTEMFMTFACDPSPISRLITDSALDRIKWIVGHKVVGDWATELYKYQENPTVCVSILSDIHDHCLKVTDPQQNDNYP